VRLRYVEAMVTNIRRDYPDEVVVSVPFLQGSHLLRVEYRGEHEQYDGDLAEVQARRWLRLRGAKQRKAGVQS